MDGISRFAKEHGWCLMVADRLEPYEDPAEFDGVIITLRQNGQAAGTVRRLVAARVPMVDLTVEMPETPVVRVVTDNTAIGRKAAEHFAERGFEHFAWASSGWSHVHELRFDGFKNALPNGATLAKWRMKDMDSALKTAPKPIAALAYNDVDAARLVAACRRNGLEIPGDVAILGIGNDPFLCENQATTISSVDQNLALGAYNAAALLHRMMDMPQKKRDALAAAAPVLIPPGQIVARDSSDTLAHPDPEIRRALLCIHANLSKAFGAKEIAEELGMSRRRLDLLFADKLHRSVGCEILRQRMIRAKRLLSDRSAPIKQIAKACGFCNAAYLTNVFRRETGLSPNAWRKSFPATCLPR